MKASGVISSKRFWAAFVAACCGFSLRAAEIAVCDETTLQSAVAAGGTIHFGCSGTIYLHHPLLIQTNVTMDAAGQTVVLSGQGASRLFVVSPSGKLHLEGITLRDAFAAAEASANGSNTPARGGAIFNNGGAVEIVSCSFLNNAARSGFSNFPDIPANLNIPAVNSDTAGGAIYNSGSLTITNCLFNSNAVAGRMHNAFSGVSDPGAGGAIYHVTNSLTIVDSTFTQNSAVGGEGGYFSDGAGGKTFADSGGGFGGAIDAIGGTVKLVNVNFTGNVALPGVNSTNVSRATFGNCAGGALCTAASTTLEHCRFTANEAGTNRLIYPNSSYPGLGFGGAVSALAPLAVMNSTFSSNVAYGFGGGLSASNSLYLTNCTMDHNVARGLDATFSDFADLPGRDGEGGGIYHVGDGTLVNCTITANKVVAGNAIPSRFGPREAGLAAGGGLYHAGSGLSIVNCTIAENSATNNTRGGVATGSGVYATNQLEMANTILANNIGGSNAGGSITDRGHNLSSDATPAFSGTGSINNIDPLLLPLADYGGGIQTMALHPKSPAADTADAALAPGTDERGVARPQGTAPDIGAFEGSLFALWLTDLSENSLTFQYPASPGAAYHVEQSTDLRSWTDLTNQVASSSIAEFSVPTKSSGSMFFRIRSGTPSAE